MQTSSKPLPAALEKQIAQQLYTVLADLKNPQDVEQFLKDFMTPTERSVFAKRLAIALSLHQNKSYEEIKQRFNVSSATISSVAEIKNKSGIKKALELINVDAWADNLAKKLKSLVGRK